MWEAFFTLTPARHSARVGANLDITQFWGYFRLDGDSLCAGINRHVVGVRVPAGKEIANPS